MNTQYTIVVADDKTDIVDSVANDIMLLAKKHRKKIRILKAISGSEVIRFAENENVDAFYLDYMFEYGMSGDEIISAIQDPFSTKYFILMSGWKENILEDIITKTHHRLKSRCKFLRKPYDPLTFQASFLEMFSFFDERLYPLPVQYVFDSVQNSKDGLSKALAIKDFFETILKFSVSIFMADLKNQKDYGKFKIKFKPNINMTFGAWFSWLTDLLEFYADKTETSFIPELIPFFEINSAESIRVIGKFKDIRDNELGHGYLKDDKWYEIVVKDYEDHFHSMYHNLQFLSRYTLIFPDKTEILPDEYEGYKYQVRALKGSEIIPGKTELITSARLLPDSLYLYSPMGKALSLPPFMIYKLCLECQAMRYYFLDRFQPTSIIYNPFCNHRIEDKDARRQINKKFDFIFSNGKL